MNLDNAKKSLFDRIKYKSIENIKLNFSANRILAEDLIASKNVPNFNRSPLDGYCFNYNDTKLASENNPLYFDIIEEVPCGHVAKNEIGSMQTVKILTGAKLPIGANCVIRYEDVEIENNKLKLCHKLNENENVILIGEDIKKGEVLAKIGDVVDMGIIGVAASLGIKELKVYNDICVGFISTGSEITELDEEIKDGKIYNSNKYIFDVIFKNNNINSKYFGVAIDDIDELKNIYKKALNECDIVISTGGVSVGDYDLVSKALIELGMNIFIGGINMKPGMACFFAEKDNKFVFALSGNPMSSVTTFYEVCLPAIKKMKGYSNFDNEYFKVELKNSFNKKIKGPRFLRGKCYIENGKAFMNLNLDQGNIVIKSLINCNAMVKVEGVDEAKAGMKFDCMLLQ